MVYRCGGSARGRSKAHWAAVLVLASAYAVALGPGALGAPTNTFPQVLLPGFHEPAERTYFAKEDTWFFTVSPLNTRNDVWLAQASDAEDDIVFWEFDWTDRPGVQVPPGMHVAVPSPPLRASDSSLRIDWAPDYDDAGVYNFRIDLSDGQANTRVHFTIVVENTNRRPHIDPVPPHTVPEGETLEFQLHATDGDLLDPTYPDNIIYMPTTLPPGAQLQDGHGGMATFIWNPGHHQAGSYTVTVLLNDYDANGLRPGGPELPDTPLDPTSDAEYVDPPVVPVEPEEYNATITFHINVLDVNIGPDCQPIPDQEIRWGLPLVVNVLCSDLDGDPITLTASSLPNGATFNSDTEGNGQFRWTAAQFQVGHHNVKFHATDGEKSTTISMSVRIHLLDSPPQILPIPKPTVVETGLIRLPVDAVDADGDPITLRAERLPHGATFVDRGGGHGQFDWVPEIGMAGVHEVRFVAESNGVTRHRDHTIVVRPAYAFDLEPIGGLLQATSPDVSHVLHMRLTNTGFLSDTYTFRAYIANAPPLAWGIQSPADVALDPGESAVVPVVVDVPPAGINARPRLIATSIERGIQGMLTWTLDVPVLVSVRPDLGIVTVDDGTILDAATNGVQGHVQARWVDGRPATGIDMTVRQEPVPLKALWSEEGGTTDANGLMTFAFHADPLALLPGLHNLTATAWRGERSDIGLGEYIIRLA